MNEHTPAAEAIARVEAPQTDAFIDPVAMEDDPAEYYPGDRGTLEAPVRRVLVRLLRDRFLHAERNREDWRILLDNQQVIESRLHDLFIRLVVDPDRGVAYKQQVRTEGIEAPVLLRDKPYTRAETLVLIYLRAVYQRESTAGEGAVLVDAEDVEQTALSYFTHADRETARRQRTIRNALDRLATDGLIEEESAGRFRITPVIEIILSAERLKQLDTWLRTQAGLESLEDLDAEAPEPPEAAPTEPSEAAESPTTPQQPEPDPLFTAADTMRTAAPDSAGARP
ncbi:DUF4194 domain-containing protein [Actinomyces sp.]|uniref:DUF4194 domain-containing protein n=1 Tax=Actinomyces sp. TaxID=29317 RepID=UPI0026DB6065|nr:DUF4194 domain-containing protein [Actinomyces sp.]MDO4900954.1 DUF4194 domain-containing protein [Actinomyces sp.]